MNCRLVVIAYSSCIATTYSRRPRSIWVDAYQGLTAPGFVGGGDGVTPCEGGQRVCLQRSTIACLMA